MKLGFYNPEDFLVLPWECTSSVFSVLLLTAVTKDIPVNLFLTVHVEFLHVFIKFSGHSGLSKAGSPRFCVFLTKVRSVYKTQ